MYVVSKHTSVVKTCYVNVHYICFSKNERRKNKLFQPKKKKNIKETTTTFVKQIRKFSHFLELYI